MFTRYRLVVTSNPIKYRLPLLHWARNFTLIAQDWLILGTDSSVINKSKDSLFHNRTKMNQYRRKIKLIQHLLVLIVVDGGVVVVVVVVAAAAVNDDDNI